MLAAGVKLPLIWDLDKVVRLRFVAWSGGATQGGGGVNVHVKPVAGKLVELNSHLLLDAFPVTDRFQVFVPLIILRILKSDAELPVRPIPGAAEELELQELCVVIADGTVNGPYTN